VDQTNSNTKTLHPALFRIYTFLHNTRLGGAQWTKPITGQITAPCIIPYAHIPVQCTLGRCTVDKGVRYPTSM
jgi:hypothetical protein